MGLGWDKRPGINAPFQPHFCDNFAFESHIIRRRYLRARGLIWYHDEQPMSSFGDSRPGKIVQRIYQLSSVISQMLP